nr:MAG TPA: hypothetical protein [Caudoviricetes sp.]
MRPRRRASFRSVSWPCVISARRSSAETNSEMPKYLSRETPQTRHNGATVLKAGALEAEAKKLFTLDKGTPDRSDKSLEVRFCAALDSRHRSCKFFSMMMRLFPYINPMRAGITQVLAMDYADYPNLAIALPNQSLLW